MIRKFAVPMVFGLTLGLALVWLLAPSDLIALLTRSEKPEPQANIRQNSGPVSYANAVRRAAPAVVNIYTKKRVQRRLDPLFDDPFLRRMFGKRKARRQQAQSSLGSGVVMTDTGYLLTSNHVIREAEEILVALQDGREANAVVIGVDNATDLAVLKIDLDNLPSMQLGDTNRVLVGDVVLAIGNPYGVGQSVTSGIISAKGKQLGISRYENFLQTDAAINPGNSGGALIDAYGNLLGINSAIFSRTGGSHGIGFAIPVEWALSIMNDIVKQGRVVRGWLGVQGMQLTPQMANSFGVPELEGMLVTQVVANGPADVSGLRSGDIVLSVNGEAAINGHTMRQIAMMHPGEDAVIRFVRKNQELELKTVVATQPKSRS